MSVLFHQLSGEDEAETVYTWAAQPGGVGSQCPPTFGTSRVQGDTQGRSNENDFCFYSRQSLFSIVQVTEFQLP